MKLSELIAPDLVVLPLNAADKWEAISLLARHPVASGRLPEKTLPAVEQALVARETSMTTGMEDGIAIPHAAVDGIEDLIAVLGLSPEGVPFDTLDGKPARIVVCLVIPRSKKLLHIRTLAEIARLLHRADVRERLLSCRDPEEVAAALREVESDS
ncbi:MAG: PTS sugar transporter subunit IIA [Planctomycetota bacterium]